MRPAAPAGKDRMGRSAVAMIRLALLLALLVPADPGLAQAKAAAPVELATLEQFQARFNQDAGTPRLVLLLSPT